MELSLSLYLSTAGAAAAEIIAMEDPGVLVRQTTSFLSNCYIYRCKEDNERKDLITHSLLVADLSFPCCLSKGLL